MLPRTSTPFLALRRLGACLAALAALVAGPALAASATLDRIKATGVIKLAYRDAAPPFSFQTRDGRVRGYSVELCEAVVDAIAKTLGVSALRIEWRPVTAATRLDAVASGLADMECGTTTITLSRMERVDFSVPIFVDGGSVLVRTRDKLSRMADLKGRKVAVIPGTTTETALKAALKLIEAPAEIVPAKNGQDGVALLVAGKVDAYAADRVVLADLRQAEAAPNDLTFVQNDFSFEPYGLVVRRDDPDFRLAVNRALVGMYKSGAIDPIFATWLGPLGRPGALLHAMFYLNALPE